MSQTTLIVLVVAVVVVIAVIALIASATRRRPRLRQLPPESRDRYIRSWQAVETRFIENPAEAVREGDRIAVMILSERGATVDDERTVPDELRQARHAAASDQGRQGTEGMRQAMVHYKRIVEESTGGADRTREGYHREVAS